MLFLNTNPISQVSFPNSIFPDRKTVKAIHSILCSDQGGVKLGHYLPKTSLEYFLAHCARSNITSSDFSPMALRYEVKTRIEEARFYVEHMKPHL